MEHGRPVNKRVTSAAEDKMGGERAIANFVNAALGKEEPLSNPKQAVTLMRIIDAIYASADKKAPVRIE